MCKVRYNRQARKKMALSRGRNLQIWSHSAIASLPTDVVPDWLVLQRTSASIGVFFEGFVDVTVSEDFLHRNAARCAVSMITYDVVVAEFVFGSQSLHVRFAPFCHHGVYANF